jgi:hypothetical protein
MRVKMILPALTEATSPFFRPIKYSLFPPLGLATLAAYLDPNDQITLTDEHVESIDLADVPDLVVIQVYITSANRSYEIADHYRRRGCFVALGGLHVTSMPKRPRSTPMPSSSDPGRIHGRSFCASSVLEYRRSNTSPECVRSIPFHPSAGT